MKRQYVAIDLHSRRSLIVRDDEHGEELEVVRIENDPVPLSIALAAAGPEPEVAIEATYCWYWAVDVLQAEGARVHLVDPLGQLVGVDIAAVAAAGRVAVDEQPRTFAELGSLLSMTWPDRDPSALAQVIRAHVPLVQVPPRGVWGEGGLARHTPSTPGSVPRKTPEPRPRISSCATSEPSGRRRWPTSSPGPA